MEFWVFLGYLGIASALIFLVVIYYATLFVFGWKDVFRPHDD